MSLTASLTKLIRARAIAVPHVRAAARFVLDALACAFAARRSPQGRILLDWYQSQGNDAGRRAFLFGSLVHVLEMDDLHRESVTHPACVVIPAAWSLAADRRLRGPTFLAAVLQGYEAVCRVGNAVGKEHYRLWHNTATCGPFGSAFAAAAVLGLDDRQTVWALGNAGTQAAGLWQFLEEAAMSKHLHAGRAAESGLLAAELAARGFTGPSRILEGQKGFFAAACPDAVPERVLAGSSDPWQLELTSTKPWPSCRHTHPAAEAALELHARIAGRAIKRIAVDTYQAALDLCDNAKPASEYEAKFSLQHCVAASLLEGALTLESFGPDARQRLAGLTSKTTLAVAAELDAAYPDKWGARLSVEMADGETFVAVCPVCKGDPESPVTDSEMRDKAHMLLAHAGLSANRTRELIDAILDLPNGAPLPSIEDLYTPP